MSSRGIRPSSANTKWWGGFLLHEALGDHGSFNCRPPVLFATPRHRLPGTRGASSTSGHRIPVRFALHVHSGLAQNASISEVGDAGPTTTIEARVTSFADVFPFLLSFGRVVVGRICVYRSESRRSPRSHSEDNDWQHCPHGDLLHVRSVMEAAAAAAAKRGSLIMRLHSFATSLAV